LGTFIATFIYALLALRTIRGGDDNAFVPPLTITLGVVLVIVSAGVLIFFIHHIASSIQADTILEQVGKELHHVIDRLYPEPLGHGPPPRVERPEAGLPPGFDDDTFPIHALRDDYLQTVDDERLMEIAREHDLVLRLRHRPGDFVVRGAVLADVWPARARDTKLIKALYRTFALGRYRSIEHDAEFGIDQIVEVATRALSTGINDPFTVTTAIDRLSGALRQLADRGFPERFRYDDEGSLRVVADTTSFSGFVDSAFNQIRQNANGSAAVLIRMLEAIERIAECVRTEEQRRSLREHARLVLEAGEEGIAAERDKRELRQRYDAATRALRAARAA
ncbi:MAG TPA: DUF2254 domain-containing protein, partial [Gammaproteobacteria bacterium]|nr:DUF2254 domain-containing protein [Gammaproteobacteria bacterium]